MVSKKTAGGMVRLAVRTLMTSGATPNQVVKAMRPRELAYMCDICDVLRSLRICDDVFFEDEDDINDEWEKEGDSAEASD